MVPKLIANASLILVCTWLVASSLVLAGQAPKYGVRVLTSSPEALAKAKTYVWIVSQPSPRKDVDAQVVAAVDRELRRLGFTKVESSPSDLEVTYGSVQRTDVDLKAKPSASGNLPEYAVGSLVIDLRSRNDHQSRFRVRADRPIDAASGELEAAINEAVSEMFKNFPTAQKR